MSRISKILEEWAGSERLETSKVPLRKDKKFCKDFSTIFRIQFLWVFVGYEKKIRKCEDVGDL